MKKKPSKKTVTKKDSTITVSGVTFTGKQVKSAVVTIGGRDVTIGERDESGPMGFGNKTDWQPRARQ